MTLTKKIFLGLGLAIGVAGYSQVQQVVTGAPFLRISPDARAGGMGDQGVATTSDAFSQFWNAAKFPFSKTTSAIGINYTPYMSKMTNDVFLLYGAYHQFVGEEERATISASIYYLNMGSVDLTNITGLNEGVVKPNEFSIDVAYGLKLSDYYSMAVTGRFIRSDFSGGFNSDSTLKAANTFAVDVSGYFQSEIHRSINDLEGRIKGGFAIQNIGPKLDYSGDEESKSYLPTTARIGAGYDLFLDDFNRVGLNFEASKLLVPGAEVSSYDTNGNPMYDVPNVGMMEGIGKSFSNKKSMMFSGAVEYEYDQAFAVRGGYFHESVEQGARQYATVGVGLKYQSFGLDLSYLLNTSKTNTALDNTLRLGLTWNIGEESSNAQDY